PVHLPAVSARPVKPLPAPLTPIAPSQLAFASAAARRASHRVRSCARACHSSTALTLASPRTLTWYSPRLRTCALAHSAASPLRGYFHSPSAAPIRARQAATAGPSPFFALYGSFP